MCISSAPSQTTAPLAPLPNANEILQRALANERKLAAERERYECRVTTTAIETDSNGNTKKNITKVKDQFFVNGIAVERTLQKNGQALTPEETKKEDERVMNETLKYSNQATAKKEEDKQNQELADFLEAMMLANGRRELVNDRGVGRSVLFYDILPNPRFEAKNLNQHLAQVMQGKISIDEQTGEPVDINVRSVADWKIGWGLFANVHKGLWLHIHNHPEADGVWLTDFAEGSGDMRAALFLHPYIHFKEVTDNCRLYTATATQVGPVQPVKKP
ncbi:MAG: hypothetical protein P4K93_04225 [Terracidiphilus sp.]|nr:hypothetical protein [Terracidiphilus sp.]MDR3797329.1 hypothetical protein [Terracidiphilus sp.]